MHLLFCRADTMLTKWLVSLGFLAALLDICTGLVTSGRVIGCIDDRCEYKYQYSIRCVLQATEDELSYLSEIVNITSSTPGK